MPITCKRREEHSDEEHTFTSFVYKPRWFVLSQTDREELEPITIPEWDADRALAAVDIERVPFDHTDGNVQGFARLCCRQHKRAYVTKSVMWRSAFQPAPFVLLHRLDRLVSSYSTSCKCLGSHLQIGFSVD